jgi:hypothetical protein
MPAEKCTQALARSARLFKPIRPRQFASSPTRKAFTTMAKIKHGTIVLSIPDELTPPDKAGKMKPEEVSRIPKAPHGLGLACARAADAITKAGDAFTLPTGITIEGLIAAGKRAEDIDQVIQDVEVILATLKQANLLFDAEAYTQLRKVNDQVKAQAKHAPALTRIFKQVVDFFARARANKPADEGAPPPA